MVVFGLLAGPMIGLLLARYLFGARGLDPRVGLVVLAALVVFVLAAGFFKVELKAGLVIGLLLGVLLAQSPMSLSDPQA